MAFWAPVLVTETPSPEQLPETLGLALFGASEAQLPWIPA